MLITTIIFNPDRYPLTSVTAVVLFHSLSPFFLTSVGCALNRRLSNSPPINRSRSSSRLESCKSSRTSGPERLLAATTPVTLMQLRLRQCPKAQLLRLRTSSCDGFASNQYTVSPIGQPPTSFQDHYFVCKDYTEHGLHQACFQTSVILASFTTSSQRTPCAFKGRVPCQRAEGMCLVI